MWRIQGKEKETATGDRGQPTIVSSVSHGAVSIWWLSTFQFLVLRCRPGHLRPPHPAQPHGPGRGARRPGRGPGRLWRMVLDACPGDAEAMARGEAAQ